MGKTVSAIVNPDGPGMSPISQSKNSSLNQKNHDLIIHRRNQDTMLVELIEKGTNTGSVVVKHHTADLLRYVFCNHNNAAMGEILKSLVIIYCMGQFNTPWKEGVCDSLWDIIENKAKREGDPLTHLIWLIRELSGEWITQLGDQPHAIKVEAYLKLRNGVGSQEINDRGKTTLGWFAHILARWELKGRDKPSTAPIFAPKEKAARPARQNEKSHIRSTPLTAAELDEYDPKKLVVPRKKPGPDHYVTKKPKALRCGEYAVELSAITLHQDYSMSQLADAIRRVASGIYQTPTIDTSGFVIMGEKIIAAKRVLNHKTCVVKVTKQ